VEAKDGLIGPGQRFRETVPLRLARWVLAVLLLAAGGRAFARAPDLAGPGGPPPADLVYGGDDSFPPYEYRDAQGEPAGFNVELIRAVGRKLGLKVRVELSPWKEVGRRLSEGSIDVASMYRSPKREMAFDFAIPHELIYHELYIRRGDPPVPGLSALADKRVLVEADAYADDALVQLGYGSELVRVASEPDALRALAQGAADVAVVSQAVGRPFTERDSLSTAITLTGSPVLLTEYAFAIRQDRRQLLEALNEGVAAVKASGEFERLYQEWVRRDRSAQLARRAAFAVGAALLTVLLVVLWNQALRRQVARQTGALRREFEARERAQAALAESERSLRQAQKMEAVGRLAGGVAHDFNNIMTVILNNAGFVREELTSHRLGTADIDELLSASERAARLTKQLLVFSRSTPLKAQPLDLCALLRGLEPMLPRLVGEHIEVEVEAPQSPVVVHAEPTQLEQMLLNLAANARDAMPRGGRLRVAVATRTLPPGNALGLAAGDFASLAVTDNGTGMDEATLARIAEPFFTTKPAGRGTGFGLASVFAGVARLNGKVCVESELGRGSTFTLLLALRDPSELAASAPAEVRTTEAALYGGAILLVEDDDALRRTARIALERAGYRVLEARDGEEAASAAGSSGPFSVLVTDVVMPRRSGPELVASLRAAGQQPLVLYVSGYVQDGAPLDLDAPGTAFLQKPYSPQVLVEAVRRLTCQASAPSPGAVA